MKDMTIFVVDDDRDFRESLVWLLEGERFSVQAFDSAEAFLAGYDGSAGLILLDIRMSGISGLALQQELNKRRIGLPVIIITGHGDVSSAVQAMKNHAVDFIEKPFDDEQLLQLLNRTLADYQKKEQLLVAEQQAAAQWRTLSSRESEVARHVLTGKSNREISEELGVVVKTIEAHRARLMRKMDAANYQQLLTKALLAGEFEPG